MATVSNYLTNLCNTDISKSNKTNTFLNSFSKISSLQNFTRENFFGGGGGSTYDMDLSIFQ